jgi:prepilin-type N-terminal cleavage/methylation domain-containing protein
MTRRLKRQDGFTLVEVLVAAIVLVLALTAVVTVVVGGQSQSSATVQEAELINIADQQIEQVRAEVAASGFSELAMSSTPTAPASPEAASNIVRNTFKNPNTFVESSCYEIASNYDNVNTSASAQPYGTAPTGFMQWSYCGSDDGEPMAVLGSPATALINVTTGTPSACSTASSATITVPCTISLYNGYSATVYEYVTDTFVGCGASTYATTGSTCSLPSTSGVCASSSYPTSTSPASTLCSDARRVTVAVYPGGAGRLALPTPVFLSTVIADPTPVTSQSGALGLTLGVGL